MVTEMIKVKHVEQIDVQMKLSVWNSLNASWLIDLCNYGKSSVGSETYMKGSNL